MEQEQKQEQEHINKPIMESDNFVNNNKIDSVNYITLEIMANSETYNKYLKN